MTQTAASEAILTVDGASRIYGDRTAVNQASFTLQQRRITCLLGPSGCGKSSLLRMIAGLEPLDDGRIVIADKIVSSQTQHIPPDQRGVGLVFQDNALFPHLNVSANIGFGLRHLGKTDRQQRVNDLLERFHISHLAKSWPHMLSGGEQQRVAIARAMARQPNLLLLDEPFSGLDRNLRSILRASLMEDLKAAGATVLIVTHDPEEAMEVADDLLLMHGGEILQSGTAEHCYQHPVSLAAARLLGDMILFDAPIQQGVAHSVFGPISATGKADQQSAKIMIRPHDLALANEGYPATIRACRFLGHDHVATVELDGEILKIKTVRPLPMGPTGVVANLDHAILLSE